MIFVLTGLTAEAEILRSSNSKDIFVLCGSLVATNLASLIPSTCEALVSFGVCGGLVKEVAMGDILVASSVFTKTGTYDVDRPWAARLGSCFGFKMAPFYSDSGEAAETVSSRAALAARTGTVAVDEETWAVAQLAAQRKIPWVALRSPSDIFSDDTIDAPGEVNPDGSENVDAALMDILGNPSHIPAYIHEASDFNAALATLTRAWQRVAPDFKFRVPITG
jgi:hypothetical protein